MKSKNKQLKTLSKKRKGQQPQKVGFKETKKTYKRFVFEKKYKNYLCIKFL